MDKKLAFISKQTTIPQNAFLSVILGEANPILEGGSWTQYYAHVQDDLMTCYKVKSHGFFKKTYEIISKTDIQFKDFKSAEFGIENGILWLQSMLSKGPLVFTASLAWTNEAGQKFVNALSKQITIIDLELFTRKLK